MIIEIRSNKVAQGLLHTAKYLASNFEVFLYQNILTPNGNRINYKKILNNYGLKVHRFDMGSKPSILQE